MPDFCEPEDPRIERSKLHQLQDIIAAWVKSSLENKVRLPYLQVGPRLSKVCLCVIITPLVPPLSFPWNGGEMQRLSPINWGDRGG